MESLSNITLNGVLVAAFGLLIAGIGVYFCLYSWTRIFGIGLLFVGFGLLSLGATNGFTDYSPRGRMIYKLGLLAFGVGVPLAGYAFYAGSF